MVLSGKEERETEKRESREFLSNQPGAKASRHGRQALEGIDESRFAISGGFHRGATNLPLGLHHEIAVRLVIACSHSSLCSR